MGDLRPRGGAARRAGGEDGERRGGGRDGSGPRRLRKDPEPRPCERWILAQEVAGKAVVRGRLGGPAGLDEPVAAIFMPRGHRAGRPLRSMFVGAVGDDAGQHVGQSDRPATELMGTEQRLASQGMADVASRPRRLPSIVTWTPDRVKAMPVVPAPLLTAAMRELEEAIRRKLSQVAGHDPDGRFHPINASHRDIYWPMWQAFRPHAQEIVAMVRASAGDAR